MLSDQHFRKFTLYGVFLVECFSYLKGPQICTTSTKQGMIQNYRLLLLNKWDQEEEVSISDGTPRTLRSGTITIKIIKEIKWQ